MTARKMTEYGIFFGRKLIFLAAIPVIWMSCDRPVSNPEIVKETIEARFNQTKGIFAMAFTDLSTGETISINDTITFHAASTMKTPVMIEVFKQIDEGKLSLEDSIPVKNTFSSIVDGSPYAMSIDEDSEGELYNHIGRRTTLYRLVYDMITSSSNLATNIVIELVDARKVTQTMRDLGAGDIQVLRGVEDIKAFELGLSNSTTARDLRIIFEKLGRLEIVSPVASQAMIDMLKKQVYRDIIPARLPADVQVANKTGSITGVHHDSGIVFLKDGRAYVLILLSKELEDFEKDTGMLADVSKILYDYVTQKDGQ